jgi:hypothetical protein
MELKIDTTDLEVRAYLKECEDKKIEPEFTLKIFSKLGRFSYAMTGSLYLYGYRVKFIYGE